MTSPAARRVFLWALYDFASSFALAVFGIYFSQWLVVDHKVSDLKFNFIFIGSSLLLLLTAPVFGVIVDKVKVKMPSLRLATFYTIVSLLGVGLLAQFARASSLTINLVITLLLLGQYFYQLSYVFYNPLLKELGPEEERAKISGYGQAAAGIGQIAGLIITLPLATGAVYLAGHRDESQVFLPTAIIFALLSLPMLMWFKEDARPPEALSVNIKAELKGIIAKFINLKKYRGIHRFFLAFFLFNDAVLTAVHNLPIYIQQIFVIDNQTKTLMLGAIVVAGAVGAFFSGWVARLMGEKKLLLSLMAAWAVLLPLAALQRNLIVFFVFVLLLGILMGAMIAVARSVLTYLAPSRELTHVFSYYAMTDRLASFLGPFVWGVVTYYLISLGAQRYQIALLVMSLFVWAGLAVMWGIPSESEAAAEESS